jgi:hypothetical protein
MKRCRGCDRVKTPEDFNKYTKRLDGLQSRCRQCQNSADRRLYSNGSIGRRAKIRRRHAGQVTASQSFVQHYFQDHPCVDCGETDPVVLEFDHVTGVKRECVSVMVLSGFGLRSIQAEIAKCEVRCANCHRRVTHQRRLRCRSIGRTADSDSVDRGSNPCVASILLP